MGACNERLCRQAHLFLIKVTLGLFCYDCLLSQRPRPDLRAARPENFLLLGDFLLFWFRRGRWLGLYVGLLRNDYLRVRLYGVRARLKGGVGLLVSVHPQDNVAAATVFALLRAQLIVFLQPQYLGLKFLSRDWPVGVADPVPDQLRKHCAH